MHQLSAQALQRPESPIQNKGCMAISLHGQKLSDFLAPIVLHLAQLTIFPNGHIWCRCSTPFLTV